MSINREVDMEAFVVMDELYGMITDNLILKWASKDVLDRAWQEIGQMMMVCVMSPTEANDGYTLLDLREKYWNLMQADPEQVKQMDIFLPDYKKPELSHIFFEEGGLRNVDEYEIGKIK